jgi:hypothetical protein
MDPPHVSAGDRERGRTDAERGAAPPGLCSVDGAHLVAHRVHGAPARSGGGDEGSAPASRGKVGVCQPSVRACRSPTLSGRTSYARGASAAAWPRAHCTARAPTSNAVAALKTAPRCARPRARRRTMRRVFPARAHERPDHDTAALPSTLRVVHAVACRGVPCAAHGRRRGWPRRARVQVRVRVAPPLARARGASVARPNPRTKGAEGADTRRRAETGRSRHAQARSKPAPRRRHRHPDRARPPGGAGASERAGRAAAAARGRAEVRARRAPDRGCAPFVPPRSRRRRQHRAARPAASGSGAFLLRRSAPPFVAWKLLGRSCERMCAVRPALRGCNNPLVRRRT